MRLGQIALFSTIALTLTFPALAAPRPHRGRASSHKVVAKHSHPVKNKILGQRGIEDDRATQIQAALIKAGYISGTPSGHWDSESEAAMRKVQADNGWQTKLVPDSRALIKLGLGPGSAPVASVANQPNPLAGSAQ